MTQELPSKPSVFRCEPVPDGQIPVWMHYYLAACSTPSDPTIVWGTDVPMAELTEYVRAVNARSDVLVSCAHVLLCAVGRCLAKHPEFNRRVVRRRVYQFKEVAAYMPVAGTATGTEILPISDLDRKSVCDVAREIWDFHCVQARGEAEGQRDGRIFRWVPRWLRGVLFGYLMWEVNTFNLPAIGFGRRLRWAGTNVNYLGHRGAPPMRSFKPSRFPNDGCPLSVTMGPTENTEGGSPTAPLFVRADHRLVDAFQLGQFVGSLRSLLMKPADLDAPP